MKKIIAVLISAAFLTTAQAEELTGTLKKIKDTGVINLGVRESSIPFSYNLGGVRTVGYSYDLQQIAVEAVKSKLKLTKLEVKELPVNSQNRISLVQNGSVDLECGSTTNNLERQKQVAFSTSIFVVGTRLLTKKTSGIKDFADLAGKNVVTTAGTTSERLIRKLNEDKKMEMNIVSAKDHGESFLTLETGRAVAFMMDDALLYGEISKSKKPDDWTVVGTPQSHEAYGCMMRKEDVDFKKVVDEALTKAMKSGQAKEIYHKWFEMPVPPRGNNLNFPLSEDMVKLYQNPNDKAFE